MNGTNRGTDGAGLSGTRIVVTVLVPFGCGYFLSYLYRTVNVVLAPRLAADLDLSAADLGFLTSLYFIVFAAFQTPLGVLLDRYGPRRVQAVLLLFAAAGSALFAVSDNFLLVSLGRGLIGLGVSGCLMAALKANVMWFPIGRLPLVNGVTVAFGSFGALVGTVPVELAASLFGWRQIFGALAVATLAVIVLTLLVVPERQTPGGAGQSGWRDQLHDLGLIYRDPFFWRVCVAVFAQNGVYLAYQSLWLGPWLRDVAGMTPDAVAASLFLLNCGMFAGVLGIGVLADRLQALGIPPLAVLITGMLGSLVVQLMLMLEAVSLAQPLCVAFGFFGSSGVLVYAVMGREFPARLVGRVNTANNMLTFISAFAVQWGVGAIINRWPTAADGRYDPAGHQAALLVLLTIEFVAFAWLLWPGRGRAGRATG